MMAVQPMTTRNANTSTCTSTCGRGHDLKTGLAAWLWVYLQGQSRASTAWSDSAGATSGRQPLPACVSHQTLKPGVLDP